jgi:peptidyl-prolyl cis-trans isomerase D
MPVREEQEASRIADSIMRAHRAGASFDTLVAMHSDDPGSKEKGGVYEGITTGRMVAPFNDFIFTNPRGATGIVKTEFGFHYIEVLEQKGSSPAYKIAYLSKPIQASQETDNNAQNAATMFAGESRDYKSFLNNYDNNLRAQGINKFPASDIKPLDFSIAGMEAPSRKLIRDIFDADKGDVVGPERVGESYVVAVVTEVNKAGLASVSRVRQMVEPILRNKKKAQQIIQQIGNVNDLEQLAAKFNTQVQPMDSIRFSGGNNMLAYEPKVIGAIFNAENKGKVSKPIAGQAGVYLVRVTEVSTVPVENVSIEDQRNNLVMQTRQSLQSQMQYGGGNPYIDVLKRNAKLKDNRSNFY